MWYHLCNFGRRHQEDQSCDFFFQFGPVVKHKMSFKDISFLELWWPYCSAEWNHLCDFSKGHYEEKFCEVILNLDQLFRRRCLLKLFLIWSSGGPFVQRSRTILAILKEGIMWNFHVKLYEIWTIGKEMSLKIFLILSSGSPLYNGA